MLRNELKKRSGVGPGAALLAAVLLAASAVRAAYAAEPAPPPAVGVAPIVSRNVAPSATEIGHVVAIQTVTVVPRVTAFIDAVDVKQGGVVRAGQPLFSLQTAQYDAALQTAQANLASAKANLENAQIAYVRAARLSHSGFEAQSNLDQALAARDVDQANVMAAQASVATANLNLSYCKIVAPIDGRVGAVSKTKGNLVTANSGALVTINQLDPIRVVFSVNSDSPLLEPKGGTQKAKDLSLALFLPNGQKYPQKGKIAFFDNQVDSQTGTVSVYADFPNPQDRLLPGAYVSIESSPEKPVLASLVPVAAVQTDQHGEFVLVVGPDDKVEQRSVTLGQQIAQNFMIKQGLSAGEKVIVDGAQKVKVGQKVRPTVEAPQQTSGQESD